MNRNNRWSLLVVSFAFFVFTSQADFCQAAPILLAEWTRDQDPRLHVGAPAGTTLQYHFYMSIFLANSLGGAWTQDISDSDVGMTFSAPPETVGMLNEALVSDQMNLGGHVGPEGDFHNTIANWLIWPDGAMGMTYDQFVPRLFDYDVTEITRTVNSFFLENIDSSTFRFGGSQTIRLYGVPEPSAIALLLIGILIGHRRPTRPNIRCQVRASHYHPDRQSGKCPR